MTATSEEVSADGIAAKTAPGTYAEGSDGAMETPEEYERVGTGAASTTAALLPAGLTFFAYPGPLTIGGFPGRDVNLPVTFKDLIEAGSSILHES